MAVENRFGTTSNMIVQKIDNNGVDSVLAIDDKGLYITTPDMVDKNLADINRYGVDRIVFIDLLEGMGLNPEDIYEENKGKIEENNAQGKSTKKLNPIKASKRRG